MILQKKNIKGNKQTKTVIKKNKQKRKKKRKKETLHNTTFKPFHNDTRTDTNNQLN